MNDSEREILGWYREKQENEAYDRKLESVVRSLDISMDDIGKVMTRTAMAASDARMLGASGADIQIVLNAVGLANEAIAALSLVVRSPTID